MNLPARSIRASIAAERCVLQRAMLVCVTSAWAAKSVIEDYDIEPEHVCVIPSGANMDDNDIPERREVLPVPGDGATWRLLFVGVDWQRKGGPIALETVNALNAQGIQAELIVVGCEPQGSVPTWVRCEGFLDKNVPEHRDKIRRLLQTSHFLLLPTRSDASSRVVCEAAAFGLPSIVSAVGGIPELIRNGTSGYLLPKEAEGAEYAETIARSLMDSEGYASLRRGARDEFERRLNWRAWGPAFRTALLRVFPADNFIQVGPASIGGSHSG